MKKLLLLIVMLSSCMIPAGAQSGNKADQRDIYDKARSYYEIGKIEEARQLLKDNIQSFSGNLLQSAYRILSFCNLALDNDTEAEEYTRLLLEENPYYSPTLNDTQRFIDMVESIKAGLMATITTASSQAETLNEVPVPITLITEEMIHDSGARNLQEVLAAYVPGMNIIDGNDDINISMRGVYGNGQEMILVMLNGHRLNSYSTNIAAPDFSISLDKLKQIEVLRGPASSLYGNVALTAVVNLITKQGADIDGIKAKAGLGSYGQYKAALMLGKRYFDIDLLVWGSLYGAKGETRHVDKEETGLTGILGHGGDVTIGGIGSKPSYDFGASVKYKNIEFLYNTQFSQVQSPMTMSYLFSPYDKTLYRTYNGIHPSFTTTSHHADLNYRAQFKNIFLKAGLAYDNSDMTHYQVISDQAMPGFVDMLPLPQGLAKMIPDTAGGFSRYINGQEHTFGAKLQGDWNYINRKRHKGLLTFGTEYNYFQLDDTRYNFGYNYTSSLPESSMISELGKGHENSMNAHIQMKHQWKALIVNAGLRFDYKNKYDNVKIKEFSPRLALIYVQPKWNVKLSYSKAFIDAPYFYRKSNIFLMAFMGINFEGLSDDIAPITLHSYQMTLGATQWVKGLNLELNAFYNKASNIISTGILEHINGGTSDIYGLEFSGKYERPRFTANMVAAWQKARNYHFKEMPSEKPFLLPEVSASTVVAWKAAKSLTIHGHAAFASTQHTEYINILNYVGFQRAISTTTDLFTRYYNADNLILPPSEVLPPEEYAKFVAAQETAELMLENLYATKDFDAYFTFDLGASYAVGRIELELNIHNLFNHKYSLSGASTGLIPQRGRWIMVDVAYKF